MTRSNLQLHPRPIQIGLQVEFCLSEMDKFQPVLKQKSSVHIKDTAAISGAASRSLRRFRRISSEQLYLRENAQHEYDERD